MAHLRRSVSKLLLAAELCAGRQKLRMRFCSEGHAESWVAFLSLPRSSPPPLPAAGQSQLRLTIHHRTGLLRKGGSRADRLVARRLAIQGCGEDTGGVMTFRDLPSPSPTSPSPHCTLPTPPSPASSQLTDAAADLYGREYMTEAPGGEGQGLRLFTAWCDPGGGWGVWENITRSVWRGRKENHVSKIS